MRIYTLSPDELAQHLEPMVKTDQLKLLKKAFPQAFENWTPLALGPMFISDNSHNVSCDVTTINCSYKYPLFSPQVQNTLAEKCQITDQWLPVRFPEREYSLLNLTYAINAIDTDRSVLKYFKSSGRLQGVHSYVFKPDVVAQEWLFKDPVNSSAVFCTSRFVELAEREAWTGLDLRLVWDSDCKPFPNWPLKSEIKDHRDAFGPDGIIGGWEEFWPEEWTENS